MLSIQVEFQADVDSVLRPLVERKNTAPKTKETHQSTQNLAGSATIMCLGFDPHATWQGSSLIPTSARSNAIMGALMALGDEKIETSTVLIHVIPHIQVLFCVRNVVARVG